MKNAVHGTIALSFALAALFGTACVEDAEIDAEAQEIIDNLVVAGVPESEIDVNEHGEVVVGGDTIISLEESVEISGEVVFDAAADFNNQNPNGAWSYGYGNVGGDFTASPTYTLGSNFAARGGGSNADGWRGLHKNRTAQPQPAHDGLVIPPNAIFLHPGNSSNQLTKIRFTAPSAGCFDVDVTWINLDEQAQQTWVWIYTNASSMTGTVYPFTPAGFKEILSRGLYGYDATTSHGATISMSAGEILSFEVGNGGDGYFNDSVQVSLVITQGDC